MVIELLVASRVVMKSVVYRKTQLQNYIKNIFLLLASTWEIKVTKGKAKDDLTLLFQKDVISCIVFCTFI